VLSRDFTYLLELCCAENRIVTSYPTDRVYLIGARHVVTGYPIPLQLQQQIAEAARPTRAELPRPVRVVGCGRGGTDPVDCARR
jgi:hypothetical protein